MALAYVNSTNVSNATATTSIVLTVPPGTVDAQLMLADFTVDVAVALTITPPGGWTLLLDLTQGPTRTLAYYRVASGEVGGTTTYTWSWTGGSAKNGGGIATLSGQDATTPI